MCAKHSAWSRWRPGRPTGPSGGSRGRRSAGAGCLPDSTGSGSPSEREAAPRGTMPVSSPATRLQPFLLSGYHGEPTRGSVTIQAFDREQRFRRAVAGLGKWWGIGLLTVLIPVAHFVLVPSFLAYGLWQFFQRLGTDELVGDAASTCPYCVSGLALELAPRWRAPQPVTCRQCHRGLRLSLPT